MGKEDRALSRFLSNLAKRGLLLRGLRQNFAAHPVELQFGELVSLLAKAKDTAFGRKYRFDKILRDFHMSYSLGYKSYTESVPIHTYKRLSPWWKRIRLGERDVCWPGKIDCFALTSGTSEGPSRYVPVSSDILHSNMRASAGILRAMYSFSDLPSLVYGAEVLLLGGSTQLRKEDRFKKGDISGISTGSLPSWFHFRPGRKIASLPDWEERMVHMVEQAPNWNIGTLIGLPSWTQLFLRRVMDHHRLSHIHELWPHFRLFVHSGLPLTLYRKPLENLFGKSLFYLETYMASEGLFAAQVSPKALGMRLFLNNGLFFEFIPFDLVKDHFSSSAQTSDSFTTLGMHEVEEGVDYALVLSSNSGAWRYLVGDVVRFVSVERAEIKWVGRTKHQLSVCGEHLSVENLNDAVHALSEQLPLVKISEFTVLSKNFGHEWYLGLESSANAICPNKVAKVLDSALKKLNDDYHTARTHKVLKMPRTHLLEAHIFYDWLKSQKKTGGQNKFPRILTGKQKDKWLEHMTAVRPYPMDEL